MFPALRDINGPCQCLKCYGFLSVRLAKEGMCPYHPSASGSSAMLSVVCLRRDIPDTTQVEEWR